MKGCRQEENSSACSNDWAEVISDLCDSGSERPANRIVALLNAEIFELNGMLKTLKNVPAFFPLVRETGSESLENERMSTYTCVN